MPQRETTGTASAPGPCRSDSPIQVKFPLETWALPHTEGDSSSHSPDNGSRPTTLQGAPLNPLQSGCSSRQQQGPDLPHPPPQAGGTTYLSPAGNQQSSWRSGKHLISLKYWANRCDQQAAAGHSLNLPWRYQWTRYRRTNLTILDSQQYSHSPHLPTSVVTILFGKLFQNIFFDRLNSSCNFAT